MSEQRKRTLSDNILTIVLLAVIGLLANKAWIDGYSACEAYWTEEEVTLAINKD